MVGAVAVLLMVLRCSLRTAQPSMAVPSGSNPYAVLNVPRGADRDAVTKAYRALAKRWHPDRNGGDRDAEAVFATIAHAYDVLMDPERREIFDRLGERGLERHRDGDPSVHKDWLPPDEVLRRIYLASDGDEGWLESVVTSSFAWLAALLSAWDRQMAPTVRWLAGTEFPSVLITATESASGAALVSGGRVRNAAVTFKFELSGKSLDFDEAAVTHTCERSRFLGMKTTFYLVCEFVPGRIEVSVKAGTFTVTSRGGRNTASSTFSVDMVS